MPTVPRLLRAFALAVPLCVAIGCNDDDNGGGPDPTLLVEATLAGNGGIVVVTDGGVAVTGADVTLNGTAGAAGGAAGEYTVALAPPVAAGGALTLEVTDGASVVQGAGTVPEAPVITAPTDGATVTLGDDLDVTWTATADPDGWLVTAVSGGSTVTASTADGTLRGITIAGASLTGGDWTISVYAVDEGLVSGDAEAGSTMEVRAAAAASPVVTVGTPLRLIRGADRGPQFNHVSLSLAGAIMTGTTVTVKGEAAIPPAANLRTFTIPGGTFPPGASTTSVFSEEDGTFTGVAVDAGSRMSIRGEQGPFPELAITS